MITPILGLGVFLSYNLIYVHKILTDTLGFHDIHQTCSITHVSVLLSLGPILCMAGPFQ